MRLPILALLVASSALFAQRGTGNPSPSPTGFGRMINPGGVPPAQGGAGFGRMVYPGTGGPPAVARQGNRNAIGTVRLGAVPPAAHPNHQRAILVPYPVFYGDYAAYDAPPAPTPVNEYDPSFFDPNYGPSPVVIINQNFKPDTANPVIRDYSNVPLPPAYQPTPSPNPDQAAAPNDAQILFLIAMKDHTIYPAVAYWVDGDVLNYITPQGVRNRASLDAVDRDFSKQLNDERHVEFALPGK